MKKLLLLLLFPLYAWGQTTDANLKSVQIDPKIRNIVTASGITKGNVSDVLQAVVNSKVSRIEANSASGTNTYAATITWLTGYSFGTNFPVVFNTGNTGASTLNVNTLGAIALKKNGGSALISGDIISGQVFWVFYDGVNFQMIGRGGTTIVTGNLTTSTIGVSVGGGTGAVIGAGTTVNVQNATTSQPGLLTSTDWNTFNSKQASGSYAITTNNLSDLSNAVTARTNLGLGSIATKTAPSGTNTQLLANDGSGGFNNVTVSTGLSYSAGSLTATGTGGTVTSVSSADGSITVTNPTSTVDLAVVKAPIWSTARLLAGNSVNGSANIAFTNKFIVQGTTDAGLSGAQFLGALSTGLVKNTTTTGILSIAISNTDYQAPITFGTGVLAALGINIGSAGAPVLFNGTLGMPSSGVITNLTGLPISTGLTGGGSNRVPYFTSSTVMATTPTFLFDGTNLGVGATPDALLTVSKQTTIVAPVSGSVAHYIGLDANPLRITFDTHNNSSASGTALMFRRSRGTAGTPLASSADDDLGSFNTRGYGATDYATASTGLLSFKANQTFTDTNMGTYASIYTTPDNSVTAVERLRIAGSGILTTSGYTTANGILYTNGSGVVAQATVGNLPGLGTGIGAWLVTPSWTNFNSTITGTAPYWATIGTTTVTTPTILGTPLFSGIVRINGVGLGTSNGLDYRQSDGTTNVFTVADNGTVVHNSTFTTIANNQIGESNISNATMRGTAGDTYLDNKISSTVNLGSTTQNSVGLNLDFNIIQTGGISTTQGAGSTATGMTATTYTNVAPASTSGSGTGSLFTVVVGSATSITSVTQTTAGSGYKVNETITFNGSQFGPGSGSVIYSVRTVTGVSLGTSTASLRVGANGINYGDAPKMIDFYYQGTSVGSIGVGNSLLGGVNDLAFYDPTGLNFRINNTFGVLFAKAVTAQTTLATTGNYTAGIGSLITTSFTNSPVANSGAIVASGIMGAITTAGITQSKYKSAVSSTTVGIANMVSLTAGGTGYTTGTKTTTGGTGTGATINITTVSSGVITGVTTIPIAKGTGYTINDVLTLAGGTGGTVTITAVDYAGVIVAFQDNNSITDANSNNQYASFYANPTYNITSTQIGAIYAGRYAGIHTSLGSFAQYNWVYENPGSKGGIGSATPDATWYVKGAGSIATLKTVGVGTSTNKSIDAYQSDGTTNILFLKDNGDFQIGLSSSKWGMFGTAAVAQQSVLGILVNNVTSGGSTSTIADFSSLTTYATDAATIRNNDYQLAKKLLAIETALRNYGIIKD